MVKSFLWAASFKSVAIAIIFAATPVHGAVSMVGSGEIIGGLSLSLAGVPLGTISGSDQIFTDVNIASITVGGGASPIDVYNGDHSIGRALTTINGILTVIDPPGAGTTAMDAVPSTYTFNFAENLRSFGFASGDNNGGDFEFLLNGSTVGNISLPFVDQKGAHQMYFTSTEPFDQVVFTPLLAPAGGIVLNDFITSTVPEPSGAIFSGIAALTFLSLRRRRKSYAVSARVAPTK